MDLTKDAHSDHISQQFNDELEQVKNHLLEMGGLVERQVGDAIKSLIEADSELAAKVQDSDKRINQMELDIDEECTRIIARRQPAASDLRLVIATSKAVNDLERIGDHARNIAEDVIYLVKGKDVRHISLDEMARHVEEDE